MRRCSLVVTDQTLTTVFNRPDGTTTTGTLLVIHAADASVDPALWIGRVGEECQFEIRLDDRQLKLTGRVQGFFTINLPDDSERTGLLIEVKNYDQFLSLLRLNLIMRPMKIDYRELADSHWCINPAAVGLR